MTSLGLRSALHVHCRGFSCVLLWFPYTSPRVTRRVTDELLAMSPILLLWVAQHLCLLLAPYVSTCISSSVPYTYFTSINSASILFFRAFVIHWAVLSSRRNLGPPPRFPSGVSNCTFAVAPLCAFLFLNTIHSLCEFLDDFPGVPCNIRHAFLVCDTAGFLCALWYIFLYITLHVSCSFHVVYFLFAFSVFFLALPCAFRHKKPCVHSWFLSGFPPKLALHLQSHTMQ